MNFEDIDLESLVVNEKRCPRCDTVKSLEDFPLDPNRPHGRFGYCKKCKSDYMRERNAALTSEDHFKFNLARMCKQHSITINDYYAMLEKQDGKCAICKSDDPGNKQFKRFCIDHDHDTGEVRGLLCSHCNRGLGAFKDDPGFLIEAAKYIVRKDI